MRIAVIDGQGGGIGKALVDGIRKALGKGVRITALGTNSIATSAMLKAGADEGATGANAIVVSAARVDIIMGAVGIIAADSMLGEITADITAAIGRSEATKILVPLNRCGLVVVGVKDMPFSSYIDEAVETLAAMAKEDE